jgi:hypothetical protein
MKRKTSIAVMCFALLYTCVAAADTGTHPELGAIEWNRDFNEAVVLSKESGRPLFMLFQEVPGCATCVDYGRLVLSHPLVAEAIETHFVPLAVFNNRGGDDGRVMKHFNEPPWNNPVVRIIDHKEQPLAKKLSGDYTISGTTGPMIHALEKSRNPVPQYLRIVHEENRSFIKPERAVVSTYCFWSGEIELGKLEGVVSTEAGFMHGSEVVELHFNPGVLSYEEFLRKAKRSGVLREAYVLSAEQRKTAIRLLGDDRVLWAKTFRPDNQSKYYLSQTPYRHLPLTGMQSIRINRAVFERRNPDIYLSPRQRDMLAFVSTNPGIDWDRRGIHDDLYVSWNELVRMMDRED